MAEVFSIVAGALNVAALFNNCVDCFGFIQLGRRFGRDFERCQLRLDIARTRLGRWGEAVKVNDDPRFSISSPTDKSIQLTQSILEEVALLFQSAWKTSERYELVTDQQDLVLFEDKDMKPIGRALHNNLRNLARTRQGRTSMARKTAWALHDGKALEKMKIYPVEAVCHKLAEIEIEEVKDEASLAMLEDAAWGIDTALSDAAAQKIYAIAGRSSAKSISTEDDARVQVGSVFTEAALHREIRINDQTINSAETVFARGRSRVQIGNTYGGRGF
ncbi:heterokaryon incompatibility protein s [Parathielavia hyrcaniae]|uniref:Heterokaryon incompatibility protein s n=1 Tax=Parathielavia hyrcaniae TaxID=113614 RepID=A0AAN6PW62_9PEZI|nr:heterokaryon incompatibility protein s [Parathielavia hyrcaniae]